MAILKRGKNQGQTLDPIKDQTDFFPFFFFIATSDKRIQLF